MIDAARLAAALEAAGKPCIGGIYADEDGVAFLIDHKARQLRAWRSRRAGPPAVLIGRWLYDLQELALWINEQKNSRQKLPSRAAKVDMPPVDATGRARFNGAAQSKGVPMPSRDAMIERQLKPVQEAIRTAAAKWPKQVSDPADFVAALRREADRLEQEQARGGQG